ncbi:hypothetical protein QFC20_005038 [Naganishia adeliensis]|uniref:Uncharacterized protein n=1 Tax=Naganishia adeliensis TaxID=92952 RepID=A0ACC2VT79_9TREE|nr:hypothetical protein QFC20_005038 [Naganishia adeliensis]
MPSIAPSSTTDNSNDTPGGPPSVSTAQSQRAPASDASTGKIGEHESTLQQAAKFPEQDDHSPGKITGEGQKLEDLKGDVRSYRGEVSDWRMYLLEFAHPQYLYHVSSLPSVTGLYTV